MTTVATSSSNRRRPVREPKQARSRDRVARIVDAAEALLVAHGYDAVSIRAIAEAAEVPTGTIYQFFNDKQDILDVLAERYLATFTDTMADLLTRPAATPVDLVDTAVDAFVELYRGLPGYRALWLGRHLSENVIEADAENNEQLAQGLLRVLVAHEFVRPDYPNIEAACRVAVLAMDAVLQQAFRAVPTGDPVLIGQGKAMVTAFFLALTPRSRNLTQPPDGGTQ